MSVDLVRRLRTAAKSGRVSPKLGRLAADEIELRMGKKPDIFMDLRHLQFSGHERIILEKLSRAYPNYVTQRSMLDAIYRHRADGGPEQANKVLHVSIHRLRKKLENSMWQIPRNGGYIVAEYRIVKREKSDG